jgi:O-antigen/teichoic acid export membrane protein
MRLRDTRVPSVAASSRPAGEGADTPDLPDDGGIAGFLHLVRRAGVVFMVQSVGAGISYGLQILLARLLGVASYGLYSYVIVWITFGSLVAGLGFPAASIRFLPEYRAKGDWARFHGFVRAASVATIGSALLLAAIAIGLTELVSGMGASVDSSVLALGAVVVPAFAASMLYTEIARSIGRVGIAFVPSLIARPAMIAAGSLVVYELRGELSTDGALYVTAGAAYLAATVQYFLTRSRLDVPQADQRSRDHQKRWFGVGITLLAAGAFTATLLQVDIVIVGALRGSHDAGLYAAASKTATLVTFVIVAVNAAAAPQFSSLWALGRRDDLQDLVARLAGVIFWPSLAISIGLGVLSAPILALFGPSFDAAQPVLIVLLVGQLVNAAAGSVGYLLVVTGHHREATRALGISAVVCIVFTVIGTAALGPIGAALGTTLGFVLWNGWLYRLVAQRLGIQASIFTASSILSARRS